MSYTARLDAAFAILQDRLGIVAPYGPQRRRAFASDDPVGVGGPLRALTLHVQGAPFALLGLTAPTVAVDKAGLMQYLCDLRERLHDIYFTSTLDQAAAERFLVEEVWQVQPA